jgi:hypothetical protein
MISIVYRQIYMLLYSIGLTTGILLFQSQIIRFQSEMILIPTAIGGANTWPCSVDRKFLISAILYLNAQQRDCIPYSYKIHQALLISIC